MHRGFDSTLNLGGGGGGQEHYIYEDYGGLGVLPQKNC